MTAVRPSQRMRDLGIVQHGAGILAEPARPCTLPAEKTVAEHIIDQLDQAMDRIAAAHDFSGKGMGLAAPQIGIARAAAAVRSAEPGAEPIVLLTTPASPRPVTRRTSSTRAASHSSTSAA